MWKRIQITAVNVKNDVDPTLCVHPRAVSVKKDTMIAIFQNQDVRLTFTTMNTTAVNVEKNVDLKTRALKALVSVKEDIEIVMKTMKMDVK